MDLKWIGDLRKVKFKSVGLKGCCYILLTYPLLRNLLHWQATLITYTRGAGHNWTTISHLDHTHRSKLPCLVDWARSIVAASGISWSKQIPISALAVVQKLVHHTINKPGTVDFSTLSTSSTEHITLAVVSSVELVRNHNHRTAWKRRQVWTLSSTSIRRAHIQSC